MVADAVRKWQELKVEGRFEDQEEDEDIYAAARIIEVYNNYYCYCMLVVRSFMKDYISYTPLFGHSLL